MATSDGVDVTEISKFDDVQDGGVKSKRASGTLEMPVPGSSNTSTQKMTAKEKIGHRRVDETGIVTYKKKPTSELMAAIQLGIGQSVGSLSSKPERDLLMQDFAVIESVFYPSEGSNLTPAHRHSDFRFKTYAPIAFRYFRELFNIQTDDFLLSLCNDGLKELSNPGASGSIFYLTQDDEFIIKTVQHKEAEFLQKLLPGYYMNLNQNPRTLLPKFYGFYCYQCGGKNIRFVVMNNLLPSSVKLHEKYDLKGSTYKRKASKNERQKDSPTLKDLDFLEIHSQGILLEKDKYDAVVKTIQRDCRVLESFKIMDYSMLLGIYNLDLAAKQKGKNPSDGGQPNVQNCSVSATEASSSTADGLSESGVLNKSGVSLSRAKSIKGRIAQYSTAIESINQTTDSDDEEEEDDDIPPGGIPAKNDKGERLLLYLGIIDILQSYRLKKKIEHTMKAIVIDGDTISVHRPSYYSQRFQDFMSSKVFRKMPTPLKHSPSKRKPQSMKKISESETTDIGRLRPPESKQRTISFSDDQHNRDMPTGIKDGRPDLLPENSTPPPTFAEALAAEQESTFQSQQEVVFPVSPKISGVHGSPSLSLSESTPTHTERTEEPAFQNELDKEDNHLQTVQSTGFVPVGKDSSSESQKQSDKSSISNDSSYTSAVENLNSNMCLESRSNNSSVKHKEDQVTLHVELCPNTNRSNSDQISGKSSGSYQNSGEGQDSMQRNSSEMKKNLVLEEEEMLSTNTVHSMHAGGLLSNSHSSLHTTIINDAITTSDISHGSVLKRDNSDKDYQRYKKDNDTHTIKHVRFRSIYNDDRDEGEINKFFQQRAIPHGAVSLPGHPKLYKPIVLRKFSYFKEIETKSFDKTPDVESTHL